MKKPYLKYLMQAMTSITSGSNSTTVPPDTMPATLLVESVEWLVGSTV